MTANIYQGVAVDNSPVSGTVYQVRLVGGAGSTNVMPTAAAGYFNTIVEYTGETGSGFTNGYFYKCTRTVNTASSISAAVSQASTGITAASVTKSTFETKILRSGTYNFIYDGANWKLDGDAVTLSDYGITYTAASATASVEAGYPEHLGTITVTAATFASVITETGDYTFTYSSADSTWKLNGTAVTLATYGIAGIESQTETATIQQIDETGYTLGGLAIDMATYKAKTEGAQVAYIFDALGPASKIEVTLEETTVELTRDSTGDVPGMNKYFWKDSNNVYYYSASPDVIIGDTITKALDATVTTVVDEITARNTTPLAGASWYNGSDRVDLTEYGITMTTMPIHGCQLQAEYFEPIPGDGDAFTINFVGVGPHADDTIVITYVETLYDYAWTRINVQPAGAGAGTEWGDITGTLSAQTDLNTALNGKQAKTSTATITTGSTTTMASNTVYSGTSIADVTLAYPATVPADFVAEVNLATTTGTITFAIDAGCVMKGNDCSDGTFTPAASSSYTIMFGVTNGTKYGVVVKIA